MSTIIQLEPTLQHKLLRIARETIESYVRSRKTPQFSVSEPELLQPAGAFVTIKTHGHLRGCIGHVEGVKPLHETIVAMAIAAATQDPRFRPVTESELADLHLEISVMTPLQRITQPENIQVGVHGILMRRGIRSGLLLPQVATEHRWERETFLEQTCLKAGLPKNAWRDAATEIFIFSAQVFDETV